MVKRLIVIAAALLISPVASAGNVEKILYHIHHTTPDSYQRTVSNLENLQTGMPGKQLDIKILLQGKSLALLDPRRHQPALNRRFRNLLATGVTVETSRKNYQAYPEQQALMIKPGLVANIFDRIIELQQQGYRYITP